MRAVFKMTWRTIRTFFGRFMAILLIVALSAGFFAGLKITTKAMLNVGENYLEKQNFYDFRLLSTIGFDEDDLKAFSALECVELAQGTYTVDILLRSKDNVHPYKVLALPDKINLPSLTAGRMPEKSNECLADADIYTEEDIGTTIAVAQENKDAVKQRLCEEEYTIVGLTNSPLYLGLDRGTTSIGNGRVHTFLYVLPQSFSDDVFTEIDLTLKETAELYSDEYEELISKHKSEISALCEQTAVERYNEILASNNITPEIAEAMGIQAPKTYVLTRNENAGYLSFENDTNILSSVANIFPIFFIAIAILVCITTMSRMVDEERTQIGVLKAMGFGSRAIMGKYLLYAGSATVMGWSLGFFVCTWALPKVFWLAYNTIYNFAPMTYIFSAELAIITLAISLIGILGTTFISCRNELRSVPASLIRPRTAKIGKRVLLERIQPLWKRLSFLQKITARNMLRYKQRLFMMLVGIGCCAGLLVTGFGVRDSMVNVGDIQYDEIQKYDIEVSFESGAESEVCERLDKIEEIERYVTVSASSVDIEAGKTMNSVNLLAFGDIEGLEAFWDFHFGNSSISVPKRGEAIISPKVAENLGLSVGDTLHLRDADMREGAVKIAAVFDNHIYNYVVISEQTCSDLFGECRATSALIISKGDTDALAKELTEIEAITSVNQLETTKSNINDAMGVLNYIIWLIIFFSATLAFIVIFNLTNINIAERSREIATVQVLGFYQKETESYVLKENIVLSVIACTLGLPLGKLFHLAVMSMVKIDMITFNNCIKPISYLFAFIAAVLFAVVVNHFMKRKVSKINMAESLKAVE